MVELCALSLRCLSWMQNGYRLYSNLNIFEQRPRLMLKYRTMNAFTSVLRYWNFLKPRVRYVVISTILAIIGMVVHVVPVPR